MSKDPASKDPDLKDEGTDPAKLRRRRKGGLRVPEDNVPRPTAAAATDEARLAMAYAYGDDRRRTIDDVVAQQEAMRGYGEDGERRSNGGAPGGDDITTAEVPLLDEDDAVESDTPPPDPRAAAAAAPAAAAAAPAATDAGAVPQKIPRASTVALSEADLEEFDDSDPSFDLARAEVRARLSRERAAAGEDLDVTAPIARQSWDDSMATAPRATRVAEAAPAAALGEAPGDGDDDGEDIDLRSEEREALEPAEVEAERRAEAAGATPAPAAGPDDDGRPRRAPTEPPPTPARTPSGLTPVVAGAKPKPPPAPTPTVARAAAVAAAADVRESRKPKRRGKPWFEEIFDEDYLRTLPFLTPQATQLEANFVMEALTIDPGTQVLDIGCGYGRHAMELAARGYHVVGLDSSLPLLLRGADEAQRRGLSINFVHGDMREINFDSQFDGAYCLFSTFGFFDDETNKKTAQNIARALKPGARCVIEVLNRDYVIADLPSRVWWEGDGCVVLEEVDFNYFSSRVVSNRSVVFDDGRQLEQEISLRSFSLHELGKLLHSAGFRVVEVSGSMLTRGRFFGAHSRDIVVVAERRVEKPDPPR